MAVKNKKAVFFTVISIILVASLVLFYTGSQMYSSEENSKVVETRILTMNSFIEDIEYDIERGLYISSMRSLVGIAEFMTENGSFITNLEPAFNELMLNSTINGNIINITRNASFGDWMRKIADKGDKLNIIITFNDLYITTSHEDAWNIVINVFGGINLTDRMGMASWVRPINITTTLNIIDFEDPLYTVISKGKLTNRITKTNITDFVSGNDASNLIKHANNSWYMNSETAPSFLMRFAGNFSSSPYGIESIINIEELQISAPEIYNTGRSSVDYIYFGNSSLSGCRVNETKESISWLRLDDEHLATYEAHCES